MNRDRHITDTSTPGTGHNSEIVTDSGGRTWLLYHAVDNTNPKGRLLMLNEVQWEDDWQFVENGTPSPEWRVPQF